MNASGPPIRGTPTRTIPPGQCGVVSLTALVEVRSKMTPGEWWVSDHDGSIRAGSDRSDDHDVGEPDMLDPDRDGMLATHNAAPVLIEVVRAALRLRTASIAAVKARMEARCEGNMTGLEEAAAEEHMAAVAYDLALAQVSL